MYAETDKRHQIFSFVCGCSDFILFGFCCFLFTYDRFGISNNHFNSIHSNRFENMCQKKKKANEKWGKTVEVHVFFFGKLIWFQTDLVKNAQWKIYETLLQQNRWSRRPQFKYFLFFRKSFQISVIYVSFCLLNKWWNCLNKLSTVVDWTSFQENVIIVCVCVYLFYVRQR